MWEERAGEGVAATVSRHRTDVAVCCRAGVPAMNEAPSGRRSSCFRFDGSRNPYRTSGQLRNVGATRMGWRFAMVITKMTTKLLSAIELVSKGGVPPTVPNDQGQNVLTPVRDRIASDQFTLKEEGRKGFRPGCSFIRNRCVVGQARAGQRCRE